MGGIVEQIEERSELQSQDNIDQKSDREHAVGAISTSLEFNKPTQYQTFNPLPRLHQAKSDLAQEEQSASAHVSIPRYNLAKYSKTQSSIVIHATEDGFADHMLSPGQQIRTPYRTQIYSEQSSGSQENEDTEIKPKHISNEFQEKEKQSSLVVDDKAKTFDYDGEVRVSQSKMGATVEARADGLFKRVKSKGSASLVHQSVQLNQCSSAMGHDTLAKTEKQADQVQTNKDAQKR